MTKLLRFLRLPPAQRAFLMRTLGLVGLVRLGLWVLPFRVMRAATENASAPRVSSDSKNVETVDEVAWAVVAASRYVPFASCLTQALASQVLLRRRGYPALLHIGVARTEQGRVEAHAWIESDGRVVVGGENSPRRYTILAPPRS